MSRAEDWSRAGWRAHLPEAADPETVIAQLGARTIPDLAAESAGQSPDRPAVTIDGEAVTHGQLDADAGRLAGWLRGRLGPGDAVLLAARSSPGFVRCYLAVLRAGAVVVLANPAATAAELGHLIADSGTVLAFADPGPAERITSLGEPGARLPVVGPGDLSGPLASGQYADPVAQPEHIALLAYTSGTTGRPKGVPLTHGELAASIRSAMTAWCWNGDDVLVHALPLSHQHGLGGVHATLIAGSSARLLSRFGAAGLLAMAAETGATVLFAVPTIYQALADAAGRDQAAPGLLRGLRLAVCGSAPLSPGLAAALPSVLGVRPVIRYGTTESGLNTSNPLADPRGDTVGVPLPGVLVRIWSGGAEAPAGADGEIQVRGPQVFGGYWRDPEATAAAFTADGWFRTGDIGCVDAASGHLLIRGRTKELIITGGMNVYPREVELVLERHPSVAEAAVAGLPHRRWGEQVTAWVVLRPGCQLDEEDVLAFARAALSAYKCPKRVFRRDSLPRNELGKVVRPRLAADQPAD